MIVDSKERCWRDVRHCIAIVLVAVAAAIALANLSSEAVTGELIKRIADRPERAYGWSLTWYWRVADPVPSALKTWGSSARPVLQWPISRYSASYLLADLAIWLAILAGAAMANGRLLRKYQPRILWRPRITTLVVLLAIAAPTVLANMSFEVSQLDRLTYTPGSTFKVSFGWPLVWNWYVVAPFDDVYGWDFSAMRLAGNVLICLAGFVLAALTSEWLLRRWRLKVRFSLRTMMAAVALIAVLCAWGASVWKRAEEQDSLVASGLDASNLLVRKRVGPKWLGLVVPDRLRRCVVGAQIDIGRSPWDDEAEMDADQSENPNDDEQSLPMDDEGSEDFDEISDEDLDRREEELLKRLGRLPALRFLDIDCVRVTPAVAKALTELRQLRSLELQTMGRVWSEEARPVDLAWLGKLRQLEHISLLPVHSDDFASLSGVTNLKSLVVDLSDCEHDEPEIEKRLAAIGKLTQLRRVYLYGFPGAHIAQLAGLVNLKSLSLDFDFHDDPKKRQACLAAVGRMTQLKRLQLGSGEGLRVRPHDLACLRGLTNLKSLKLFISSFPEESHACLAEIGKLTQLRQLWLEGDLVGDGLAELAPLESLEEITSDNRMATVKSLESLTALKRLSDVCIAGLDMDLAASTEEAGRLRRALQSLERARPGIALDRDYDSFWMDDQKEQFPFLGCEPFNDRENLDTYLRLVPMGP